MDFPNKSLLYFLLLLLLPSFSVNSEPYQNVTLGSFLIARTNGSYWSSPSGDFAFGFLQLGSEEAFLLAIWFNKIPEKTVVWSVNGNNLAPGGSTVKLTNLGNLVLEDPVGKPLWTPNVGTNEDIGYGAMLDTGNFVLIGSNFVNRHEREVLWQSFVELTDTLLPSQTFNLKGNLIARYSETNYSTGRYQLALQEDGNLVLYPRKFPTDAVTSAYWATMTLGSGFQLVFNLSGSIYLTEKNGNILTTLTSNTPSTKDFYHRAILEYDGVFRHYVYPKMDHESNSSWPKAWSQVSNSTPPNICLAINGGYMISGACGFNSYCSLGVHQRPNCTCLPHYDMVDPNDVMEGCKPSFASQTWDELPSEMDDFEFSTLENVNFPTSDYRYYNGVTEDECKRVCLRDRFCLLIIFRDGECWKQKFPLAFGRMDSSIREKAFIKVRKLNSSTFKPNNKILLGSVLLGSSAILYFILFIATSLICYRFNKMKPNQNVVLQVQGIPLISGVNLRIFSYEELTKATSGFIEQLGRGSFATVYKGILDSKDNNNLVAVKKLDNVVEQGDHEFEAEVNAIARTNHKNLVRLLGVCSEGEHRMLVYEFMPNGSLANFLFGPSKPNWHQRIQLVLGTARGLCYLHEECSTQIIHCDIKPQNILLDDSFTARIADFGLAKLLNADQTRTMTVIRGTKGYVAAEWFKTLPITVKVDVYSFGILLLEMICCRRSFEAKAENENEKVLADWAYDCFNEEKVEMLVENDLEAKTDLNRVINFVMIAIWCIQEEPSLRPSMKKVVQMLEGVVRVSFPPNPSPFNSAFF